MSEVPTYFSNFLGRIRLSVSEQAELKSAHTNLTTKIQEDPHLKDLIIGTFLQGSYKRSTIVKPANGKRSDVDVVVVTKIGPDVTPKKALEHFVPFVRKHYKDNYEPQSRSIGIVDGNVDLDLVITSAPSEAQVGLIKAFSIETNDSLEEFTSIRLSKGERRNDAYNDFLEPLLKSWKDDPLQIPDRDANKWEPTHPIAQIKWTTEKNKACNDHYINVVKAIKWWHRQQKDLPKYPKGYPVEHMIGHCCPDGITSIAQGVTLTLENFEKVFLTNFQSGTPPYLKDHGVNQNVLHRMEYPDFKKFYERVREANKIARRALDAAGVEESVNLWRSLFGSEFDPEPEDSEKKGGFVPPIRSSDPVGGRFG